MMIKSAKLEWALNNMEVAIKLLEEAIKVFADYAKLHMMKGQIEEQMGRNDDAHNTYTQGVSYSWSYLLRLTSLLVYSPRHRNKLMERCLCHSISYKR